MVNELKNRKLNKHIDPHQYVIMKYEQKIFKMLADSTRLKIIDFLLDGERCVCEIIPHTKRTQSTVSIQVNKLEKEGILSSRRDGKKILYKIKDYRICKMFKAMGNKKVKCLKQNCCKTKKR